MRNHEVVNEQLLLDEHGELREPGWSRDLMQQYRRAMIKAPKFRIKEWDYYLVVNDKFAAAFTISDDGYIGLQSASFLDLGEKPWEHTETILNAFPMGKLKLPTSSASGVTKYKDKRLDMHFDAGNDKRVIFCDYKNFHEGKTLKCDITLAQPPMDTMVIATPWREKKTAFYYNQKINCMRASGTIELDGVKYELNPETDYGTLDWGRGVWTYDNTWYWGSGNMTVNGKPFGFNIGYGFGDTTAASENMLFYDGKCHKLDDVTFNIPSVDGKKYKVTQYLVNDDCNFFDEWCEDRETYGIGDDCFGWSPDDPCLDGGVTLNDPEALELYRTELRDKYIECSQLIPETHTATVTDGVLVIEDTIDPNGVIFYEITVK
jgi:hypothetical protein